METEFTLRKTMDSYNFYSIPREIGKLDSTAFNTPEGTILEARKCCGLFYVGKIIDSDIICTTGTAGRRS